MEQTSVKSYVSPFPHGLMFHRFHREEDGPSGQGSLTAQDFEKILLFVDIDNILTPEEWLSRLKSNRLNAQDVCLTLDDGLRSQIDVCLPIMEKHGLKAFWFVFSHVFEGGIEKNEVYNCFAAQNFASFDAFSDAFLSRCSQETLNKLEKAKFKEYVERARIMWPFYSMTDLKFRFIRNELLSDKDYEGLMDGMIQEKGSTINDIARNMWISTAELKMLSEQGHCIGLHSYSHPYQMIKLSLEEQALQYRKNYEHLKNISGQEIVSMSHPVNSYNEDTLTILKDLGIVCGFRSNMAPPEGKHINASCLELAREDSINILKRIS